MTSMVENEPRSAARAPTLGYQIASMKAGRRRPMFIKMLTVCESVSCFPVKSNKICARSIANKSAFTIKSWQKAENLIVVASKLVVPNMFRQFCWISPVSPILSAKEAPMKPR